MKTGFRANPFARAVEEHLSSKVQASPIGVALSGGVDSILLAHTLHHLSIPFIALHFNHRWREKASDADAKWVKAWCAERGIKCYIGKAKEKGPTSENKARMERWAFFKKMAHTYSLSSIWMAHHADDLVETFLLQLLRGAGIDGLISLAPSSRMEDLEIKRPWLQFWKEEIIEQAKNLNLSWREDSTNQELTYARNRLRLQILPMLQQVIGRDPRKMIYRTAQILAEENNYWSQIIPETWPSQLRVKEIANQPIAWQRRALRAWLKAQGIQDLNFETIENVRKLLTQLKPAKTNLHRGYFCKRQKGFLMIQSP